MKNIMLVLAIVLGFVNSAGADRGPVMWQQDVSLTQESQKAIIFHNGTREVLILGTELKASSEIDLLEFIPLPSEPKVTLASSDPFKAAARLITEKGLVFLVGDVATKGGAPAAATAPVEIHFSEKIGLHDVTAIKINDIDEFARWLDGFFRGKGIEADSRRLSGVLTNARDYMKRGYNHFVFDYVKVADKTRFVEPLIYSFTTEKIYYPLKTSNLIGGKGMVEMILVLPGSITDDIWQDVNRIFTLGTGVGIELSSSSKLYRAEAGTLYSDSGFFGQRSKIYMQVFRYKGPYNFKDDFTYDIARLVPYAHRFHSGGWRGMAKEFSPPFTVEEIRDLREVFCPKSGDPQYIFQITDYRLDCWDFIPREEYEVYAALFRGRVPSGIPHGWVELQKATSIKELRSKKISTDKALLKDFNDKNRISYSLENAFPDDGVRRITIADDRAGLLPLKEGKTYVSRVGFDKNRSTALVHVDHMAGPRAGAAYYVTLQKKDGEWVITNSVIEAVY